MMNATPLAFRLRLRSAGPALHPILAVGTGLAIAALVAVTGLAAWSWVGVPFPGFFVLPNRVVASVGLPSWPGSQAGIYQHHVVAVAGLAPADSAAVYDHARQRPSDTPIAYTLRGPDGRDTLAIRSTTFTEGDYWAVFGGYLLSGGSYLAFALLAVACGTGTDRGRALLLLGATGGIYALSAVALYTPSGPLRLHVVAEAAFPAALAYLAMTLAHEDSRAHAGAALMGGVVALGLAVPGLLLAYHPGAYSTLHAANETAMGLAGAWLLATIVRERLRLGDAVDPLLRCSAVGAVLGMGVPAMVLALSGLSGGKLPVNVVSVTAFLFPLSICLGVVGERAMRSLPFHAYEVA